MPDIVVPSVVTRLEAFFRSRGEALSAEGRTRTAQQVVKAMCQQLGVAVWDLATSHGGSGVDQLWRQWGACEHVAAKVHAAVVSAAPAEGSTATGEVAGLAELLDQCELHDKLGDAQARCTCIV